MMYDSQSVKFFNSSRKGKCSRFFFFKWTLRWWCMFWVWLIVLLLESLANSRWRSIFIAWSLGYQTYDTNSKSNNSQNLLEGCVRPRKDEQTEEAPRKRPRCTFNFQAPRKSCFQRTNHNEKYEARQDCMVRAKVFILWWPYYIPFSLSWWQFSSASEGEQSLVELNVPFFPSELLSLPTRSMASLTNLGSL